MEQKILKGVLLDDQTEFTLNELCTACSSSAEWIIKLVEEAIIEPVNLDTADREMHSLQVTQWRFTTVSLQRAHTAMRLQNDLNINLAGVALALNLLERIEKLEGQLRRTKSS